MNPLLTCKVRFPFLPYKKVMEYSPYFDSGASRLELYYRSCGFYRMHAHASSEFSKFLAVYFTVATNRLKRLRIMA